MCRPHRQPEVKALQAMLQERWQRVVASGLSVASGCCASEHRRGKPRCRMGRVEMCPCVEGMHTVKRRVERLSSTSGPNRIACTRLAKQQLVHTLRGPCATGKACRCGGCSCSSRRHRRVLEEIERENVFHLPTGRHQLSVGRWPRCPDNRSCREVRRRYRTKPLLRVWRCSARNDRWPHENERKLQCG